MQPNNQFDPILLSQQDKEVILATMKGVGQNILTLEQNINTWRDATFRAVNLLSERDAGDDRQRRERQIELDRQLWWLRAGIVLSLVLQIAWISVFIGTRM